MNNQIQRYDDCISQILDKDAPASQTFMISSQHGDCGFSKNDSRDTHKEMIRILLLDLNVSIISKPHPQATCVAK